ncbi:MAG: MarR family winged helix-turn-helix transcriptional regulator [Solirubrobacteraceae bacterium]
MGLAFDPIEEAARQWREHWGVQHVAEMKAVTSVMRVQQIWLGRINAALAPFDLTFARYEAVMLLHYSRAGELPLGKIGARLQVHPTSVTNLIDGLERGGLVRRAPHPRDGRTTLARLTAAGRGVAIEATAALHAIKFGVELPEPALRELFTILRAARTAAGDFDPAGP